MFNWEDDVEVIWGHQGMLREYEVETELARLMIQRRRNKDQIRQLEQQLQQEQ